ncbi:hypothetical protein [Holospora elegans]|uniref:hypothetical protein n=1 Tax=Holospora elegans TaxID=431043 RepID=UPI00054D9FA7|nr:hypothetical protein [Holospora elegans]
MSQTFKRLFEQLKNGKFYFIAQIIGQKIIPSPRLFQGKDKTFFIEQNNAPHLYWFAKFRRKTLANTR